jgi:putative ABC transport system permease protein
MSTTHHGWLIRFYRWLLRFYPAAFRDEYETQMTEMVAETQAAGARRSGTLALAASLVADVVTTAPREHLQMLREDARHAWRTYTKSPALTACLLLVFAIGLGATTAIFTLTNAVLLRPLPFHEPERLVFLDESAPKRGIESMGTTFPGLLDYQRQNRSFAGIGAYFENGFNLSGDRDPERVDGAFISWNLFSVLGVQPMLGRTFRPEEDQPNVETAVIISHALWERRYGGDAGVLGRTIQVAGRPRTVVGIMPAGFRFPDNGEIWVPMALDVTRNTRTDNFLTAIGRLGTGVSLERARADMAAVMADIGRRFPDQSADVTLNLLPVRQVMSGEYQPVLVRLLAAALFVLAIACTNVTNLLLARAAGRHREIAVRTALGANRRRIVRQLVTESLLVGLSGGLLGLAFGVTVIPAILRTAPIELPYWIHFEPDWRVLAFSALVMTLAGIVSGLAPAVHATRIDLTTALSDGGKNTTAGRRAGRLREGLVMLQLALSVVLLVGAGLMVRSFINLAHVDLGFRTTDVLTFRLSLPRVRYPEDAGTRFYKRALETLSALPGVERAGAASMVPFAGNWWRTFLVEGETKTKLAELPSALNVSITPGYLSTMGVTIQQGRDVTDSDSDDAPVLLVNRTLANHYWPGQDPIGRRITIDSFLPDQPWRTIVGVVNDVRWTNPREPAPMTVYVPHVSAPMLGMMLAVRAASPLSTVASDVRAAIKRLDPELPVAAMQPVSEVVSRATWNFRLYTQLFAMFAAIAMLLAAVGLAGIMTQMVVERRQEIGVRLALGATPVDIIALVVRRATVLVTFGTALGLAGALALARTMSTLLFGVTAEDAPTLGIVLVVLGGVAVLAGVIPARQASRVSPLVVMRAD